LNCVGSEFEGTDPEAERKIFMIKVFAFVVASVIISRRIGTTLWTTGINRRGGWLFHKWREQNDID
jgi:hypothetical protein